MAGQLPGNEVFPGGAMAGAGRGGGNSERKACFGKPVKLKIDFFLKNAIKNMQKLPLKGPFKCKKHNIKLTRTRQL